jgi:formate dehydrogenase iron-sulfur subunit
MSRGVLVDLTRCVGCRSCQVACKAWNDNPGELTQCLGCYDNPPSFSADTWSLVRFSEVEDGGQLHWVFSKLQCMHCEHPGCAAACPVGALRKSTEGPVVYDDHKCLGCRYCMVACPFGVPAYEWDRPVPFVRKCTFCVDRVGDGVQPACVKACPTGALQFGGRDELLAEARQRIAARPGEYVDHIYGEHEVGGTSWMYISPVPFEKLGFVANQPEKKAFPALSSEAVTANSEVAMLAVPPVLAVVAAAMSGLYWLTKRRAEAGEAEASGQEE